ncbi:MAG: copper resistance system multicopper oxidase [Alphaproteobacteria bacterium]|nr:MAG: copper resistance system multicopper oxidase [Alphaproteobacteria bacterium]
MRRFLFLLAISLWSLTAFDAQAAEYRLDIARGPVNVTDHSVEKITINGGIPGPTLRFTDGDEAVIHVSNHLDEATSIHWHGLILPGEMDGVPGFNKFPGIKPGETFTYRFRLRQTGTYWYHAHSIGQEQDGHYGSIIVAPRGKDPIQTDRDYVVLLSDFTEEDSGAVMANLKMASDYYNVARRTIGDFFDDVKAKGFSKAWKDTKDWGEMRMSPTDLSDVSGYTFLMNGKSPDQNWTGIFKPGERVRLRFINASAMSIYDVRIPGLKMTAVQADGQNIEPLKIDEFRFAPAETYDVVVTPEEDKAYTVAAESIDRTGFALGTLATRDGMRDKIPTHRQRALLTMGDMGSMMDMENMVMTPEDMKSGWADAGTPKGDKALSYKDLRYAGIQKDTRDAGRTIDVRLGGNMERYIWTLNGKKFMDAEPIRLKYGERVRLTFTNETMMAHPMHLHGMFVQLENGQPLEKLPNKHTVLVPPGQSYSVLLTADEVGEWAFHCHLLYHMMSGMMTKVVVAKLGETDMPVQPASDNSTSGGSHAH